ncbi:MAG: TldD/PmbA family protein, partial [Sphingomonadales bacterium]|nr:TldD/PmbA family protein [Sphingomonadales bacterium]
MQNNNDQNILDNIINIAKKQGASEADAVLVRGLSLGVSVRHGALEDVERSEGSDLGLRVIIGKKQACVSSSSMDNASLDTMVDRAISMAKVAPDDPYCGLADTQDTSPQNSDTLDLYDNKSLMAEELEQLARDVEAAAIEVEGISNSEGGSAGFGTSEVTLATSNGFVGSYKSSSFSLSVSAIAGEGTEMERDYDYATTRHFADLPQAEKIGLKAAQNTLRRLSPRKVKTQRVPIVFDPRVAGGLVGHLAGAINGSSIARGTSFLKDSMGDKIFNNGISIIDDALLKRGLRSKAFDGEGLATGKNTYVKDGVLQSWVLDSATARQLGLASTARASRGTSSPPSPSVANLYMENGDISPDDLIADIKDGFYITELIGMGVNGVTGDYSRGATGLWIKDGKLTFPVSEVTITSNLK